MEHKQASVQIHWTTDYGMFKFLRGNRDLNEPKIKRIIKSVHDGLSFFQYCPIMVNDDMYIIDGQHRFAVCQQLKINVYYVIVHDFSLRQIAEMNNNASKWKDKDFLNCYMDVGIEDYKVLHLFAEKHDLNVRIAASLLMYGKVRSKANDQTNRVDDFRDGKFKVRYQEEAERFMNKAFEFNPFTENWNTRSFLQSMEVLQASEKYNQEALIDKLSLHNLVVEQRSTYKEYLQHIEELYNYRNSKRLTIY